MSEDKSLTIRFRVTPEMFKLAEMKGETLGKSAHQYARTLLEKDLHTEFIEAKN